jgi:glucokinase
VGKQKFAIGIDIGGTNTEIGLVSKEGEIVVRGHFATRQFATPSDFIETLKKEVALLMKSTTVEEVAGVGIGAPNGNYYKGTIEFAPNLVWRGVVPLAKMVKEALELPAYLTNDANAAAIGEMIYGGAKGMKDFILITIGTGLGSGIVVNGGVLYGHDGFAGELGHTIVYPENGRRCTCGRNGCLEAYVSARGIIETYFSFNPGAADMQDISTVIIADRASQGEEAAIKTFDYTGKILGLKLADAVAFSSPEAIFLFGGVTRAGNNLFNPVKRWMEYYMLEIFRNKIPLLPSALPQDSAAILGASALVWKEMDRLIS